MLKRSVLLISLLCCATATMAQPPPELFATIKVMLLAPDGKTPLVGRIAVLTSRDEVSQDRRVLRNWPGQETLSFQNIPEGLYRLSIYFQEFNQDPFVPKLPPAATQDITVNEKEMQISIKVTGIPFLTGKLTEADGKRPVANKPLNLQTVRRDEHEGLERGADYRVGRTNEAGAFFLPQPPPEPCILEVTLQEHEEEGITSSWSCELTRVTPKAEADTVCNLSVPAFPSVTGRIFDPTGAPVARSPVDFRFAAMQGNREVEAVDQVTTSEDGNYLVPRIPFGVRASCVRVRGKGYAFAGALSGKEGEKLKGANYRLLPFATVTLKVREPDGKPVADLGLRATRQTWVGRGISFTLPKAITDAGGSCVMAEVPEGCYTINATQNAGYFTPPDFTVAPGQKLEVTVTSAPIGEGIQPGSIEGRVTDGRGQPVAGAQVYLNALLKGWEGWRPTQGPFESRGDGSFQFTGVPAGRHVLLAVLPGRPHGYQLVSLGGTNPMPVIVTLPPTGSRLVGRVTDEKGSSMKGISVGAFADIAMLTDSPGEMKQMKPEHLLRSCADPFPHTTTDEQGRYVLETLAPGNYTVVAVGEGFPPCFAEEVPIPRETGTETKVNFSSFPESARRMEFRVFDAQGQPLANTAVTWRGGDPPGAMTDAEGRLRRETWGPGRYDASFSVEGFEEVRLDSLVLGTEVETKDREIRLKPLGCGAVAVRVLWGDTNLPAAGVAVQARPVSSRASEEDPLPSAMTDAEGKTEVQKVIAGKSVLVARPPGPGPDGKAYSMAASEELQVKPGAVAVEVTLRLPLAGSLSGVVQDADGKAATGVRVTAYPPAELPREWVRDWPTAMTGTDGGFMFAGLAPGEWRITAQGEADHRGLIVRAEAPVESGKETKGVVLQATRETSQRITLTGQVFELDGVTPAAAVPVSCPAFGGRYAQVMTDADGKFSLNGAANTPVTVEVWLPGVGSAVSELLQPVHGKANVLLTAKPCATVTGRVVRSDGRPVTNAVVVALPKPPFPYDQRQSLLRQPLRTWTDETGAFRLSGLPPGRWLVHAEIENLPRTQLAVTVTTGQLIENLELRVEPLLPEVTGRVLGPDGRTPVADAAVICYEPTESSKGLSTTTDEQGGYRLQWVMPGEYQLQIRSADKNLAHVFRRKVKLSSPASPDIVLPKASTIVGRVIGAMRIATPYRSQIRTYRERWSFGMESDLTPANATLKPNGSYRLERLAPGDYSVYYFDDPLGDEPTGSVKVTVKEGEEVKAEDMVVKR